MEDIKEECVGRYYQILYFVHKEGLKKIKDIFLEMLRIKAQGLLEDYEDETRFFLDILENLVDKDYDLESGMNTAKKASKYYVSPRYFERL